MQLTYLDYEIEAPDSVDRVRITKITDQRFRWGVTVARFNAIAFKAEIVEYPTRDTAEQSAFAWAGHHGVKHIYVESFDA